MHVLTTWSGDSSNLYHLDSCERSDPYSITQLCIIELKTIFVWVCACDCYSDQKLGLILTKFCAQGFGRKILVEPVREQHRWNRFKINHLKNGMYSTVYYFWKPVHTEQQFVKNFTVIYLYRLQIVIKWKAKKEF